MRCRVSYVPIPLFIARYQYQPLCNYKVNITFLKILNIKKELIYRGNYYGSLSKIVLNGSPPSSEDEPFWVPFSTVIAVIYRLLEEAQNETGAVLYEPSKRWGRWLKKKSRGLKLDSTVRRSRERTSIQIVVGLIIISANPLYSCPMKRFIPEINGDKTHKEVPWK